MSDSDLPLLQSPPSFKDSSTFSSSSSSSSSSFSSSPSSSRFSSNSEIDRTNSDGSSGSESQSKSLSASSSSTSSSGRRMSPLQADVWNSFQSDDGKVSNVKQLRVLIFYGGIAPEMRKEIWPFLLNVYPFESTHEIRKEIWAEKERRYFEMKTQWTSVDDKQLSNHSYLREIRSKIQKDVIRTDRSDIFYAGENNKNVGLLFDILMTHLYYNWDLGYEQGLNDLLSPILMVMEGDEAKAFWCFVGLVDMIKCNFEKKELGIQIQLEILRLLLRLLDPALYQYFEQREFFPLIFCFRWILLQFKREFSISGICHLWEIFWSRHISPIFHLFIAMAIFRLIRSDIFCRQLGLEDMLQYVTILSGSIPLEKVILEAESLYYEWTLLPSSSPSLPSEFTLCLDAMKTYCRIYGCEEIDFPMMKVSQIAPEKEAEAESSECKSPPSSTETKRRRNTSIFDSLRRMTNSNA